MVNPDLSKIFNKFGEIRKIYATIMDKKRDDFAEDVKEVKEKELLLYILSHGILIPKSSLSLGKTMTRRSKGQEICSMLSGFWICS